MLEEQWSEIFWGNEREDGTHTKILGTQADLDHQLW